MLRTKIFPLSSTLYDACQQNTTVGLFRHGHGSDYIENLMNGGIRGCCSCQMEAGRLHNSNHEMTSANKTVLEHVVIKNMDRERVTVEGVAVEHMITKKVSAENMDREHVVVE